MINGILNIYKEKGWTSHDVVARLRGIVGQKKIGHTGTLDPDAEGVLPVCLGRATKVCDLLTDKDKTYETVLLLGKTTDTQDISGAVLAERQTAGVTEEDVLDFDQVLATFPRQSKTSMLQDVEAKRKTEVDSFAKKVIEFGKEKGVPTPINEAIYCFIHGIELQYEK